MKKETLLPYKFPFLMVVLGAVLFALVWNVEIAWISWPVGILGMLLIIGGLAWLNIVANAQYEDYLERNEIEDSFRFYPGLLQQKLIYYSVIPTASILVYAITISGAKVDNHLNWKQFLLEVVITALVAGIAVAWLYSTKYMISFNNKKWQEHIKVASFLIPLLVSFHFAVWYNHLQPSGISRIARGVVTDDGGKYLHITFEGEEQRFTFGQSFNETLQLGDSVSLTIKQGALGYSFVSKISRIQ